MWKSRMGMVLEGEGVTGIRVGGCRYRYVEREKDWLSREVLLSRYFIA